MENEMWKNKNWKRKHWSAGWGDVKVEQWPKDPILQPEGEGESIYQILNDFGRERGTYYPFLRWGRTEYGGGERYGGPKESPESAEKEEREERGRK